MFARLGRWCHDRRGVVVITWIALLFIIGAVGGAVGKDYRSEFNLPNVESERGVEILEDHFGGEGAGSTGTIVFRAEQGIYGPQVEPAMEKLFAAVRDVDGVLTVDSPYDNPQQISQRGAEAGKIAFANVEIDSNVPFEEMQSIVDVIDENTPEIQGLQVEKGEEVFAEFEVPESEALGLAFAIFILILAFGSVLAMGLPIGVALAGIGVGITTVGMLSQVMSIPDFSEQLGMMIGIGVGIDYALFIVTRFRENMHNGMDSRQATINAINSAGRAVAFAGTTVVISLLGMLIMGLSFVNGLAVSAAAVVAITMVASLTLLPALLGFAKTRVEVTRRRGLIAAAFAAVGLIGVGLGIPPLAGLGFLFTLLTIAVSFFVRPLKREVPRRVEKPREQTLAYRWSRAIQHRPWLFAFAGTAILVVLTLPLFGMRLGFADESNYPESTTTYKAYEMISEGFGPGFNGPFILAAEVPQGASDADLEGITAALRSTDGVDSVSDAQLNDEANPTAVRWFLTPDWAPQDRETGHLVHELRDDVLPQATEGTGIDVSVAGTVPVNIDFSQYLSERLPYFFVAVLALSFVLLMVVFRSILVPLKAVIMNLLSIGAAYGVVVAVFQWGWAGSLLGVEGAPIEPWLPMMLFAIVFGLSMDYEVFLLSRVKEEWDRTGDSHVSVADGLAVTARVITAAALIMVFVFGSFMLEDLRAIKLFGMGLAVAVLLDATVVRMLLVPATMELLGDRNWWLPRWLNRILPTIDVEGHGAEPSVEEPSDRERQPEYVS